MAKFLIVGLGNIGSEYTGTRHNIGFDVADELVKKHGGVFGLDRLAEVAEIRWKGKILVCIKPTTFMNLSGKAVKYWMDKEKISLENVLVVLDELALPLSKFRLRPGGSAAGHNGLRSIEEVLGTNGYPRLRFGIGNNFPKGKQVDYVLGKWKENELPLVRLKVEKSVELIESFATSGIERTMNQYNNLDFTL
ncbi:aminoacyl-tRNA hydrolase [Flavitalea sp. BT771]|uniref:aminoacyl-tRNA hydrolase n=1 Tax=Flavitalea sp. BT771 TaxID=3063329 RepID=UPI0026E1A147|nr:aminoacyl-tRNA hydrolase [Flavitalea sp. BT771]MDO6429726.1 aminoacyl-tRNA hydrolase [Flavitalea sp. BT771]MDV6218146.1 aminoacyl-tRNA hydrolase [Flavitalea sp. BT771]